MAAAKKDRWDIAVSIATIVGMVGTPVVLAILGNNWQQQSAAQQIRKDYVQLAVGILSTRPISKDDPLRPWAVELINENSPVKLSLTQRKALQIGAYVWKPGPAGDPAFEPLPAYFQQHLGPALESLLDAAGAAGAVRPDVDPGDLLRAVGNLCLSGGDVGAGHSERMVDLLIDGLRYGARAPAADHPPERNDAGG
jgi:hypothetical protein